MAIPRFTNARHVESYFVGTLLAVLFTDCGSIDDLEYVHVLYVYQPDPRNPPAPGESPPCVMMVASVVNRSASADGSHTLMIQEEETRTISTSDRWSDLNSFRVEALDLVKDQFEVGNDPMLLPMRKHPGYDNTP